MKIPKKIFNFPTWLKLALYSKPTASGCCEWQAYKKDTGYGLVRVGGRTMQAHRASYECLVGPIPSGMEIDHLCRNRSCINPRHLEPVTKRENQMRGMAPGILIYKSGKCAAGHQMSGSNLYISPNGKRGCRQCMRSATRRYNEKKRA